MRHLLPAGWKRPSGYSAGIAADGELIFVAGMIGWTAAEQFETEDLVGQLRQALVNIRTALACMGGTMADVISLTHYATDVGWFMECGDLRKEFFSPPYPVTTTVQVAALYHPDLMIEIAAIAEIPRDRFKRPAWRARP